MVKFWKPKSVWAQGPTPWEAPYAVDDVATLKGFENIFQSVLQLATTAAGLAVFIMLIVGGFKYFTSGGDPQKVAAARSALTWAIAGLAIMIGVWFVLLFIEQFTGIKVTIFEIPIDSIDQEDKGDQGNRGEKGERVLPLRDSVQTRGRPFIVWLIILANVAVFLMELAAPDMEVFVEQWGLVAAKVDFGNLGSLGGFITSQFLHGGLFHLLSNMWFLKIFGDNVEDEVGHLKFLLFYLLSGIVAAFSQYIFMTGSEIPMIGASGAVAGVLGAYFVFFPHHRVETLIPVIGFWRIVELPAALVLFYWFITQVIAGFGSLVYVTAETGGVAFLAHAGGFAFGWGVGKLKVKS